jgi:hypothetical protein
MNFLKPLLLLGVAGGALAFMFSTPKEAHAKQLPKPDGQPTPREKSLAEWQEYVAAAIQSGDVSTMRNAVNALDAAGLHAEARELKAYADDFERQHGPLPPGHDDLSKPPPPQPPAPPPPPTPPKPGDVVPPGPPSPGGGGVVAPGGGGAPPPPAPDVEEMKAAALALHLKSRQKGREDRQLVRDYQEAHGMKVDGLYGIDVAELIANHGTVPPTPFYWPKKDTFARMRAYKAFLQDKGKSERDPDRIKAWFDAASRVKA